MEISAFSGVLLLGLLILFFLMYLSESAEVKKAEKYGEEQRRRCLHAEKGLQDEKNQSLIIRQSKQRIIDKLEKELVEARREIAAKDNIIKQKWADSTGGKK